MIVESEEGVTLAGGALFGARALRLALGFAPRIVAADGGADRLWAHGVEPEAVFGDFDSISTSARARLQGRLFHIPEQETTDFDKALRSVRAPFTLCLGFSGARLDHGLAVLNALARHAGRHCLILSRQDVTFLAPPDLSLDLPRGTRLSLFPLGPARAESQGLEWPTKGIAFAPAGMIGCSNRVTGPVRLCTTGPMLVILPLSQLGRALAGLGHPPPVPAG